MALGAGCTRRTCGLHMWGSIPDDRACKCYLPPQNRLPTHLSFYTTLVEPSMRTQTLHGMQHRVCSTM